MPFLHIQNNETVSKMRNLQAFLSYNHCPALWTQMSSACSIKMQVCWHGILTSHKLGAELRCFHYYHAALKNKTECKTIKKLFSKTSKNRKCHLDWFKGKLKQRNLFLLKVIIQFCFGWEVGRLGRGFLEKKQCYSLETIWKILGDLTLKASGPHLDS